ncbi:hypothetical protein [Dokdonella sp.]|uniref:hypothetical protein n=1 Tax=Dokdonella sp. TaxID=2291710 RepID=UPI0025C5E98F|nr:hypothetical protein [Dokdonella sp.]MBX3687947.1 hypothetical protein [Dokdonella sp.]
MTKLALLVSALILLGYLALMRLDPLTWGWLRPRGGLAMQAISLAIANFGIHLGAQAQRSLNMRFQLAASGWIWLLVQAGGVFYLYTHWQAR